MPIADYVEAILKACLDSYWLAHFCVGLRATDWGSRFVGSGFWIYGFGVRVGV